MSENMHHVLYQRRSWNQNKYGKELRSQHGLIVPMDEDIHSELHRELFFGVPVLGAKALKQVFMEAETKETYLDSIDSVLFSIARTRDPLADIAIHAIEAQLPYIKAGLTRNYVCRDQRQSLQERSLESAWLSSRIFT